jgi:hypothetical protein
MRHVGQVLLFVAVSGLSLNLSLPLPAAAEPLLLAQDDSAAALVERVRARSQKMNEYRALLRNPDPTIRLAALDEMTKSNDPAVRELAFEAGFATADSAMRALALKAKLAQTANLMLEFKDADNLDKATKKWIAGKGGRMAIKVVSVEERSGQLNVRWANHKGSGQVSGTVVNFSVYTCKATFQLAEEPELQGEFVCRGTQLMPTRVRLM